MLRYHVQIDTRLSPHVFFFFARARGEPGNEARAEEGGRGRMDRRGAGEGKEKREMRR